MPCSGRPATAEPPPPRDPLLGPRGGRTLPRRSPPSSPRGAALGIRGAPAPPATVLPGALPGGGGGAAHLGTAGTAAAPAARLPPAAHLLLAFRGSLLLPITATAACSVATGPGRSQSGKIPRQHTRRLPTAPRLRLPLPRQPRAPLRAPGAACMLISATSGSPPRTRPGSAAVRRLKNTDIWGALFFPPYFLMLLHHGIGGMRVSNLSLPPEQGG